MSVSLYYSARRERPLSEGERAELRRIVAASNDNAELDELLEEELEHWQGLDLRAKPAADEILSGSSRLPSASEATIVRVVEHLCRELSELRRRLPDASWEVHIDDVDIPWDDERRRYEPGGATV
jgi:hypothetical protein